MAIITFLEKYREPLTKGMSILTLLTFFGFNLIGKIFTGIFDVNETMGWKLGVLRTWIDDIPSVSIIIFFGVYLLLHFLKIKTDLVISVIHLFLIASSTFLYSFWELDLRITLLLISFSFVALGANCYKSLIVKRLKIQKSQD